MRRLLACFLGQLGALDAVFQLLKVVATVLVAELLLDRLHLLVEIVLALGLLHLALHPRADALLHLEHGDFALHQPEHLLQPVGDLHGLQHGLLLGDLHREMGCDGVGKLGVILDLADDADHLGRHLLVELHIVFELVDHRARERLGLDHIAHLVGQGDGLGLIEVGTVRVLHHLGGVTPSTSTFTVPSGSFRSWRTVASVPTR